MIDSVNAIFLLERYLIATLTHESSYRLVTPECQSDKQSLIVLANFRTGVNFAGLVMNDFGLPEISRLSANSRH